MLNNFVNFDFLFTKLSGIDRINISGGHAWRHVFMACSKLEAMVIYLVKQACGNDKLACVYRAAGMYEDVQDGPHHILAHYFTWYSKNSNFLDDEI